MLTDNSARFAAAQPESDRHEVPDLTELLQEMAGAVFLDYGVGFWIPWPIPDLYLNARAMSSTASLYLRRWYSTAERLANARLSSGPDSGDSIRLCRKKETRG